MQIEEYEVFTDKINNINITHISDIHLSQTKKNIDLDLLINSIKMTNPNYIVITGDFYAGHKTKSFTDPKEKELVLGYLNELKKIAPIVMSLGNHDIKEDNEEELRKEFLKFEEDNVHPVDRDYVYTDENRKINFIGYMQPKRAYSVGDISRRKRKIIVEDIYKYMPKSIKNGYFNIGLVHTPVIAHDKKLLLMDDYPTKKLDLVLSGHHHNGLVDYKTVIKLEKLSDKLQKRFPKHKNSFEKIKYMSYCESPINKPIPFINFYARGMHVCGGVPTIISKGVGGIGAAGKNRDDLNNQVITKISIINSNDKKGE